MPPVKTTDAERFAHLTSTVHDQSSAVQAMQGDLHRLNKAVDKLVVIAEKQAVVTHELNRHGESIDRAFKQMDGVKSELAKAIEALTATLREDREKADKVAETVTGYKGGVRALIWAGGTITALILMIGGMFATSSTREQNRTNADIAALEANVNSSRLATDAKLESITRDIQEARLGLRLRATPIEREADNNP